MNMTDNQIHSAAREIAGKLENVYHYVTEGLNGATRAFNEFSKVGIAERDMPCPIDFINTVTEIIRRHRDDKHRTDVINEIEKIKKTNDLLAKSYKLADKALFNLALNHKNKMPWQVDKIAELKEELAERIGEAPTKKG